MRLPLAGNISTKDGASNKNARMVNVLAEEKQGKTIAAVRPGLNAYATASGNGNGLMCFGGELVSVFGANIGTPSGDVIEPTETITTISGHHILTGTKLSNGLYVLCEGPTGDLGDIFTTTDFSTYTMKTPGYQYLLGKMVGNGSVAVCSYFDDLDAENYGVVTVNTSGTTTFTDIGTFTLAPICYGNGVFVAATGNSKFATSSNGTSWTEGTFSYLPISVLSGLEWNGSKYCYIYTTAVGGNLYARTSTDLETWSSPVSVFDTSDYYNDTGYMTVANGFFVIVMKNGCARSEDGINWTVTGPFEYDFDPRAITYNASVNKLCAVGSTYYFNESHARYFSFNGGQTWFPDDGTYLTPDLDTYTGVIPKDNDFVTFRNEATNNVQVLTGVGFGITNISAIEDNPVDFAFIP
jgi:hypothetical protein